MSHDPDHQPARPFPIPDRLLHSADFKAACLARDWARIFGLVNRRAGGASHAVIAAATGLSTSRVSDIIHGRRGLRGRHVIERVADGLRIPGHMLGIPTRPWEGQDDACGSLAGEEASPTLRRELLGYVIAGTGIYTATPALGLIDHARSAIEEILDSATVSGSTLDAMEEKALQSARDHVTMPPGRHIELIATQLVPVMRLRSSRQPTRYQRRLSRIAAQLSGLLALDLAYLGSPRSSQEWFRVSYRLADDAIEPELMTWARAQATFLPLNDGNPRKALDLANAAREQAAGLVCAGSVLAAASQGRAYAQLGDERGARSALAEAADLFAQLDSRHTSLPVFGITERRFSFYIGSALSKLGDTEGAWDLLRQALSGYPPDNYGARVLITLERAECLADDGEPDRACELAAETLNSLTPEKVTPLVVNRAHKLAATLPEKTRKSGGFQDFRDVLATITQALPSGR